MTAAQQPPGGGRDGHPPEEVLAGFARSLRAAGLGVTAEATTTFVEAVDRLDLGSRPDVYWAGRATFCRRPDDLAVYDRTFTAWFTAAGSPGGERRRGEPAGGERRAALEPGRSREETVEVAQPLASPTERLRSRDLARLEEAERVRLDREFEALEVRWPMRRTRRTERARHGRIDRVATLRDQRRRAGEPGPLRFARRRLRGRRVVLLIDVSGSMRPYADALLRLGHRVCQAAPPGRVEVFTLGTRLTRVTAALRHPDPEEALLAAGAAIPDWAGGTRLADVLGAFVRRWGRRGMARGAVVVIASDGWERGDPRLLAREVRALRGLAHRIVWANPHAGKPGYEPIQAGIAAVLPFVDSLVAGHSFDALAQVLMRLSGGAVPAGAGGSSRA